MPRRRIGTTWGRNGRRRGARKPDSIPAINDHHGPLLNTWGSVSSSEDIDLTGTRKRSSTLLSRENSGTILALSPKKLDQTAYTEGRPPVDDLGDLNETMFMPFDEERSTDSAIASDSERSTVDSDDDVWGFECSNDEGLYLSPCKAKASNDERFSPASRSENVYDRIPGDGFSETSSLASGEGSVTSYESLEEGFFCPDLLQIMGSSDADNGPTVPPLRRSVSVGRMRAERKVHFLEEEVDDGPIDPDLKTYCHDYESLPFSSAEIKRRASLLCSEDAVYVSPLEVAEVEA